MQMDREAFLQSLQAVEYGLSNNTFTGVAQAGCFVFKSGLVMTYNDEVSCCFASGLDDSITAAVAAKPLISLLSQMSEKDIEIDLKPSQLVIAGKGKKTKFKVEQEINLPVEEIEQPENWQDLHQDFSEALKLVQDCASNDAKMWKMASVHIHPKWLEAGDNFRVMRYQIPTPISQPMLVKRNNLKPVSALGMTEVAETATWLHFRNSIGLLYSCRRYLDEYHNVTDKLKKTEGEPVSFPKTLDEAAKRAEIFSSEDQDVNLIRVDLEKGWVKITGTGLSGEHRERKKCNYKGEPRSFQIFPKLLVELVQRHTDCYITDQKVMIDGGRWRYVSVLNKTEG